MLLQLCTGLDEATGTERIIVNRIFLVVAVWPAVSTMDEAAGASLNVDVTKFMGLDMKKNVSILEVERENNELLLFKMLEEGLNADIILTARGGSVKAHRCVLSAASPVFRAMFRHDMKEQISSTVDIPDMTIEGLQLFLLVLYTINEHIIDDDDEPDREPLPWLFSAGIDKYFGEFLRALVKYQAFRRRLESLLEVALNRNLTPHNCWEYYDILLQFDDEVRISSIVRKYIVNNFQVVVESEAFLLEMRRNPDGVNTILNAGISSISKEAVMNHIKSQSKKARRD